MKIEIVSSKNKMQFKVSEDVKKKIEEWRTLINEEAYNYQIKTGFVSKGYKDRINERLLDLMKQRADEKGVKRPYEGVSGGGTSYNFSITDKGPILKVYSYLTKRTLIIKNMPVANDNKKMHKLTIMFSISGSEFRKFKEWEERKKSQGDDIDYVYSFGPTSIGTSIKVMHRKTKAIIDLTDYDSW